MNYLEKSKSDPRINWNSGFLRYLQYY